MISISRREALAGIAATGALPLLSTPALAAPASEAQAIALLGSIGENLLRLQPAQATSLGIDTDARASYRLRLEDRSAAGQAKIAATLKADLARADAIDTSRLTFPTRTSVEVVKSAYRTALEGFAQPYGDVAVGGWRNTPYVVIQNVGAYNSSIRTIRSRTGPTPRPTSAALPNIRSNSTTSWLG